MRPIFSPPGTRWRGAPDEGRLALKEAAGLFWHCAGGDASRERIGQAMVEHGLAKAMPVLRTLLGQILQGRV